MSYVFVAELLALNNVFFKKKIYFYATDMFRDKNKMKYFFYFFLQGSCRHKMKYYFFIFLIDGNIKNLMNTRKTKIS
jgi:hypothetical protein